MAAVGVSGAAMDGVGITVEDGMAMEVGGVTMAALVPSTVAVASFTLVEVAFMVAVAPFTELEVASMAVVAASTAAEADMAGVVTDGSLHVALTTLPDSTLWAFQ